jgi:cytochrome P450
MTMFELIKDAARGGDALMRVRHESALRGDLPFTSGCVKEALRLHPPAPLFFRVATADAVVGGYPIKKGAAIIMSAAQLGRDPSQWGNDADEFRPQRFLIPRTEMPQRDAFAYLPFGAGPRACLGSRVAMAEIPSIVAAIVAFADLGEHGGADSAGDLG